MRIVSAQPAIWRWPTSSASWKVCSAAASAASQSPRRNAASATSSPAALTVARAPASCARRHSSAFSARACSNSPSGMRVLSRMCSHGQSGPSLSRPSARRNASASTGRAWGALPRSSRVQPRIVSTAARTAGSACVAEQADGPLGQLFGLDIGVDGRRAVGGVGEHLRRQHRPPGRDTVGLADQQGHGLGGAAPPDLQPATELLGPGALLFAAGQLGRLSEQGERTIGHARGGCRLAGRDQAAARGFWIRREARRSLQRARARGVGPARHRPAAGPLQGGRHLLIGPDRGRG